MATKIRGATALTGGGVGAVDAISGAVLADGDIVVAVYDGQVYTYVVDADSGLAESSPHIIAPDVSAGDKRLILQSMSDEIDVLAIYGDGVNRTRTAIEAAKTALGVVSKYTFLIRRETWTIDDDLTITSNFTPKVVPGALLQIASGKTLTIEGPFEAGLYRVFSGDGSVVFGAGAVKESHPEWWGWATGAGAAQQTLNSTAWQAAIDSNAGKVTLPNGTYSYSTGITVGRAIRIDGAGSSEDNGEVGYGSTQVNYTGAGVAITLVGSGANGKENVHLSNFILSGTSSAIGGIYAGSDTNITKSSLKNIVVKGFTKSAGYGLRVGNFLESVVENVIARGNYDGIILNGTNSTLKFDTSYSGSNTRYGWNITKSLGASFVNCIAESNAYEGLYIYGGDVASLNFYNFWSEDNNTSGLGNRITIDGSVGNVPAWITFHGGRFQDTAVNFNLGYAENVVWLYPYFANYVTGFITLTNNTLNSQFYTTRGDSPLPAITGNHKNGIRWHSGATQSRFYSVTLNTAEKATLPYTSGIILINDLDNNTSAIFSLNGSAHTTTLLSANSATYSNTLGNAATTNVAWDTNAYKVENKLVGLTVTIIADTLLVDGI